MMREKLKNSQFFIKLQRLRNDMKPMSFWQKLSHLWYCFHVYIISIGTGIAIFSIIFGSMISYQSKEQLVNGILVNLYVEPEGRAYLSTDYEAYLNAEKDQVVGLEYINFGTLDDYATDDQYNQAYILIARVEGKMVDYMILDKEGMITYISYDVYCDLREFFTPEEIAGFEAEDRLIYAQPRNANGELEERYPIAVKITDIPFVKDNVKNEGDIYFALSGHDPNFEKCRNAWNYLHAWEGKKSSE